MSINYSGKASHGRTRLGLLAAALAVAVAGCAAMAGDTRALVGGAARESGRSKLTRNVSSRTSVSEASEAEAAGRAASPAVVRGQEPEDADTDKDLFSLDRISEFSPSKTLSNLRQLTPFKRDENLARERLASAEKRYAEKNFNAAADDFYWAAFRWPNSILEEDALFYLGECYFFADKYPKANKAYGELLKKYSNTRHIDIVSRRQFQIARYWQELHRANPHWPTTPNFTDKTRPWFDTKGRALSTYSSVWTNDPTSPLADDSVIETANQYFVDGMYQDADFYYDLLRDNHPQSEHLVDAYILGLQSKMRSYQGAEYDPTPLNKSGQMVDQMLGQFHDKLGAETENVVAAKAKTRELLAERRWYLADYYGRNRYHGASRKYLQQIVKDYPDTSYASRAQQRLQQIAGEPDVPRKPFQWLIDVLPESAK